MGNSLSVKKNVQDSSAISGKELINTFTSLVTNLKSKSFHSLPDPTVVAGYICDLPISRNSQASANLIPQLRNAQSLDQVFELIGPFIKFNQYDLLTYLVDKFGEEDAKKELQQYSYSVEQFNSATTVGQLVELLVEQQEEWTDEDRERLKSAQEQGATIKMVLDNSYSSRTLDKLQQDVQSLFDCEEYVLALAEANFGSIEFLWYTSLSVVSYLAEKARENEDKLEEMSVIALMIGNDIIKGNFPSLSSQSPHDFNSLHDHSALETHSSNEGNMRVDEEEDEEGIMIEVEEEDREEEQEENGEVSTDGLSSNVSIEVIVVAIRAGLALQVSRLLGRLSLDALVDMLQQVNEEGLSLLHIAVSSKSLDTVRAVLSAIGRTHEDNLRWLTDAKDVSPLHLAFQSGDLSIIEALLKYPSFTVIPPDHKNLLKMATEDPEQSLAKLKLILEHSRGNPLTLYPDFQSHFPTVKVPRSDLESTIPVIVVGDSNVGKSTLIESLQIEGVRSQLYHLFFNVSDVSVHKAGIIPIPFESIWFGNVVFYDLSSNREFVHESIQQCGFLSDAVFIVVVNLHDKTPDITKQLVYWLDFIHYHHQKVTGYDVNRLPNIAIVGSHAYQLRFGKFNNRKRRFFHYAYPRAACHFNESRFNIITRELMDCRKSSVSNTNLRLALSHEFQRLRANRTQIPSKSYMLYGIIKELCSERDVSYVTIVDVLPQLYYTEELFIIEPNVSEVIELCQPLCKLNLLLVLQNEEDLERSWVIVDSGSLLSKVEEAIFGEESDKPSDGIMTHNELSGFFKAQSVNPDMMIKLMTHYCYCTKISDSHSPLPSGTGTRYFFPHILPETPVTEISQQDLMFAWSIRPTSPFHHFMPHIIHHFLFQLSQEPEISRENYDRARHTLITSFPSIGLELVVHVFSNQTILVSMKSENNSDENKIKCLEMRNRLIAKVRHVLKEIDSHSWDNLLPVEALMSGRDPLHPVRYPVFEMPTTCGFFVYQQDHTYSVEDVRLAVKGRLPHIQPIGHPDPLSSVEDLLIFEPYFYMSDEVRSTLIEPENSDDNISPVFFESLARDLGLDRLYLVLSAMGIPTIDIEDIRKNAPKLTFLQVLGMADAFVQGIGITYGKFKVILDSISFFKLDDLV